MHDNPFFSSRPPTCPNNPHVINALLLKFTIRRALQERLAVSYQGRVVVQYVAEETGSYLSVYLPAEPSLTATFPDTSYGQATDRFIDTFINSLDPHLEDVGFHEDNSDSSPAVRWGFLRQSLPMAILFSDDQTSLANRIKQIIQDEETHRTTDRGGQPR